MNAYSGKHNFKQLKRINGLKTHLAYEIRTITFSIL